jgi:CubicO group peptidase (beta-lactamase class C family)
MIARTMSRPRRLLWIVAGCLALALAYGVWHLSRLAPIGTAYTAKVLCSGVFVAGRPASAVLEEDVRADQHPLLRVVSASVDTERRRTSASLLGMATRVAQYRPSLGCTLALGVDADRLLQASPAPPPARMADELPEGAPPAGVDARALRDAVESAFADLPSQRTRAVVVMHGGRVVAQRYAAGFSAHTPLPGWSMSKTVTAALAGVLVREGRLSLDSAALLPEWRTPGDPRARITLDQMLRMTDGLAFAERYEDPFSDVVVMLFGTGDSSGYAASKPLEAPPGTRWRYSSGTSNALIRALRAASGRSAEQFSVLARTTLFEPIGMRDAVFEIDAASMPVASSYVYASAHDWVRFGQLLMQDGVWRGRRILPAGWVRYLTTLTPQSTRRDFGAHVWLRVPPPYNNGQSAPPPLPADAFHLAGHEAQLLTVIPSRKLVVLRLGLTREPGAWDHEAFLSRVLEAFPEK